MVSENFEDYSVENDQAFKDFKSNKRSLSRHTLRCYRDSLNMFCRANEKTLDEICAVCEAEQVDKIVGNNVHRFSPNNRNASIKRYFNNFIDVCEANDNKPSTINARIRDIRVFFNNIEIEPPKFEKLDEGKKELRLLTKDDINFVMNDVTLTYKALITFILSTGMREADVCNLTIGDFMEATKKYHDFVDAEEFIDNAPKEMIGYYDFFPQKTRRHNVNCKTFNSPESSDYILQNLRRIKNQYMPRAVREKKLSITRRISKKDALFGSRSKNFLGGMQPKSITDSFTQKNMKLRDHHIAIIDQKIAEGKISAEDREECIEKIPKFHPHALRKYFITTINSYGDYRTCLVLEGHKSQIRTDESYVQITKDDVEAVYIKALSDLSLKPTEAKIITDTQAEELKQQVRDLTKENKELLDKLSDMETSQSTIQSQMVTLKGQINSITNKQNIISIQDHIMNNKDVYGDIDEDGLKDILELYESDIKNKGTILVNEGYIESLITRVHNKKVIDGEIYDGFSPVEEIYYDDRMKQIESVVDDVHYQITQNTNLKMSKAQEKKINKLLAKYMRDTWLKKEEADTLKISEIIKGVLLNG